MDIHWRDSFQCPTEEQYLQMIRRKTGGLFGLGVKLMQLFSEDERDYTRLISLLGTYFQIRDDFFWRRSERTVAQAGEPGRADTYSVCR